MTPREPPLSSTLPPLTVPPTERYALPVFTLGALSFLGVSLWAAYEGAFGWLWR